MKQNSCSKIVFSLLLCSGFAGYAFSSPLVGNWVNVDENTRSVVELEIVDSGNGKAEFKWVGKTHPENSTYGPFPFYLHSTIGGGGQGPDAGHGLHETNFSHMLFVVKWKSEGMIFLEAFTRFTDDSGRKSYREEITLRKK